MRKWLVVITWNDGAHHCVERVYTLAENWRLFPLLLSENLIPDGPHQIVVSEVHA